MTLTQFALILTVVLLGVTGYLAWEGQQEARGAREELRFIKQQQAAHAASSPAEDAMSALPITPQATATISPPAMPAITPGVETDAAPLPGTLPLPGGGLTVPKAVTDAAAAAGTAGMSSLTPRQKDVAAAIAVARVKTVVADQGFIVIDAGSRQQIAKGMKFDIRRGNAVLGRVTVTDAVEENDAVADIDLATVPAGVEIEPGDELIHPVGR